MRTTFTLEDDVAAEVERIRRVEGLGISEVVNRLIRRGLASPEQPPTYVHMTSDLGARYDIGNVGEVLDLLDEDDRRGQD